MKLITLISFNDSNIDKNTLQTVITMLQEKLWRELRDIKVSISGPMNIGGSEAMKYATHSLALHLPIKDLLNAFPFESLQELINFEGIKKFLGQSELGINVQPRGILFPFSFTILNRMRIPKFKIPIYFHFGIFSGNRRALQFTIDPIIIDVSATNVSISSQITVNLNYFVLIN